MSFLNSSSGKNVKHKAYDDTVNFSYSFGTHLIFPFLFSSIRHGGRITYEATLLFRRALREAAETAAGATSSAVAAGNATDPASVQAEDSTATNGAGNLDIVRLPPWLTGSFITPFGGGGGGNTNADGGGAGSGSSTSNSSSRRNRLKSTLITATALSLLAVVLKYVYV